MVALFDTAGRVDLELDGFEAIPAGDRFLLLRIGGRWSLAEGVVAPAPRLVLQNGSKRERFDVLPGAEDDYEGDWWAGFAVPAAATRTAHFWLEAGDEARYPLPAPVHRELLDGQRPQIVVRGGRPYLLVAAGLMAAALIPLSVPSTAGADEADPAAVTPAPVVTAPVTVPTVATPPAPAPTVPVTPTVAPAEPVAPAKKKPKAAQKPVKAIKPAKPVKKRKPTPAPQVAPPVKAGLDPTPHVTHTPSPLLARFAIPPFLLPIYQAAAAQYDVPWEVLAAINSVETDYGRNVNISSAGAQGWMQFMPSTWSQYGVDANFDGRKDAGNPADAIFAAARYLRAAGASQSLRRAIYAYNHADWYVDMVLGKARALRHLPTGAVSALTGLADGRFPVPGSAVRYTHATDGWVSAAAHGHKATLLTGPVGRPVVAAVGGKVIYVGHSRNGDWLVLEDAHGNLFTYGHLGWVARNYPTLRRHTPSAAEVVRELGLDGGDAKAVRASYVPAPDVARETWPNQKERLFAHPTRPEVAPNGGREQLDAAPPSVVAAAARQLGVRRAEVVMARLRPGAEVPAGTLLGRLGGVRTRKGRSQVLLRIRPAGKHARTIDPSPLLEAWRLGARGALGPMSARTKPGQELGIGRTLLLSDRQLGKLVLRDDRVHLTRYGRDEVRAGLVDRRVLVALETLARAGQHPSVAALRSGPEHPSKARDLGRAVDIVALNGAPVAPNSEAADAAVRALETLPEALRPARTNVSIAAGARAQAASTASSTAEGRLTVGFRVAPETSAAVSRAVNAALGGSALRIGAQTGGAPDLKGAPERVKAMADAADAIAGLPYIWGGGHGAWEANGYDCSGSVSYVLHAAGLLGRPLVSGDFASWGEDGEGHWVTIYANATHVIMKIGDQFYGTSGFGHPESGGGPGWFSVEPSADYLAGFSVRHPAGL